MLYIFHACKKVFAGFNAVPVISSINVKGTEIFYFILQFYSKLGVVKL